MNHAGTTALTPRSFARWFAPPELARPDLRRRARALWIVSWPFFALVATVLAVAVLVEPNTLERRATTVAAVGALVIILHVISRSGRPVLASWILVVGLSIIVTQRAWITGGIHAPVPVFYAIFIVMAGVLLGGRAGVATAVVCLLGAVALTIGTSLQWLTSPPGAGSPIGAFVFVVLAIGLALLVQTLVISGPRRTVMDADGVQMVVHDMRSPMQVLLANLQLLRAEVRGETAELVDEAIGGAKTLNRMTNSILDVGRLEAGQMPVRRTATDLSALARAVVRSIRALEPGRDIAVETSGDPICSCDPELTRRIIENLVSNAVKHTPSPGRVRVSVAGSRERAYISVSDEGLGVPREKRARLFERYSADGLRSASGVESTGLGLTFCRLAAEAQGGTIWIEDRSPSGSVFVVELPC